MSFMRSAVRINRECILSSSGHILLNLSRHCHAVYEEVVPFWLHALVMVHMVDESFSDAFEHDD